MSLTTDMLLVLGIFIFTTILFISNVIRVDVVAVLVLALLGIFKLLPPEQLFSGFSSEAAISLISIMIISAGLENAGISVKIARWILKLGRENPRKIVIMLMTSAGLLASFMRSLGTVALFLPIVTRISSRTGISKTYLLLPIAFSAILGGTLTMIGTAPLIILNSLLKNAYHLSHHENLPSFAPFQVFAILPVGLMLLAVGMIYLIFINHKLKSEIKSHDFINNTNTTQNNFKKTYGKGGSIFELRILPNSTLINKTIKDLEIQLDPALSLIALFQDKEYHLPPLRNALIKGNAILAIMGDLHYIEQFAINNGLKLLPKLNLFSEVLHPIRAGLCEAVIPPSSQLIGKEIRELHMKRKHGLHVLALRRGDATYQGSDLNNINLRSGDTLGMFSRWESLHDFQKHPDFFVLTTSYPREKFYPKKMPQALLFFSLSLMLVLVGAFPISVGLLIGAVGMIATGVLSVDQAYESVSWRTVFLLAGLMPLGLAMQITGIAEWLTSKIFITEIRLSPLTIQISLSIIATALAVTISNIGATVVLVPIALDIAMNIGADPRVFALTVALAASNTFILPTHQVNALIAGPGLYKTKDFVQIGGWMTIIFWIVLIVGLYLFF